MHSKVADIYTARSVASIAFAVQCEKFAKDLLAKGQFKSAAVQLSIANKSRESAKASLARAEGL